MAGHGHPAVMKAVEERLHIGTLFGMPHGMELELAEEICARYPVDMVRFGNSGSEVTMYALRLARAVTGRSKIVKIEGGYHGGHDAISVSVKPKGRRVRRSRKTYARRVQRRRPKGHQRRDAGRAVQQSARGGTALPTRIRTYRGDDHRAHHDEYSVLHAGRRLHCRACARSREDMVALLIMDEVKTGAKLAWGGACEYFDVKPDIVCLGKSIGGGFSLAAFRRQRATSWT